MKNKEEVSSMSKPKLVVLAAAVLLLLSGGNALAVPSIDGTIGPGEWSAGLIINSFDPNEGGIPDDYDIFRVAMIQENSGGSDDGLYILIDLYGTPTFTSLDETNPPFPVSYRTAIDVNRDGDFNDAVDRIFDFRATGFTVFDGTGTAIADTGTEFILGPDVVEFFIPEDMLGGPFSSFDTFTRLDNGGEPADDRVPDRGFDTTIPEPATMALFGSGLLGALGYARRKSAMKPYHKP